MERKIKIYSDYGFENNRVDLVDLIALMTANIEEAYQKVGIEDYTEKECFDKGFELAKEMFMHSKNLEIEFYKDFSQEIRMMKDLGLIGDKK